MTKYNEGDLVTLKLTKLQSDNLNDGMVGAFFKFEQFEEGERR